MSSRSGTESSDSELRIHTFIRVKPLDSNEEKSPRLEFGRDNVTIKADSGKNPKTLPFDKVFNETASQKRVYETVVKPLVKEVLQGYNCTVFAYGQTSTGKTYTMSGDFESLGENNIHSGMIPRAMADIFSELENLKCEYQVNISYLELYNEKMRSLLKFYDDEFNIQVLEGTDGKIILKGLILTPVKTKEEALNLLKAGMQKKQIASTKMNINSSRSHTIFTITVGVKEVVEGNNDDVIRIGKLHMVDLAGSENVSKSGASEVLGAKKRINEMSNINRSLLSLGRVIISLTENNPHIPYRESKLTRFLKDSLGGNTKTCMVGTISSSDSCLDETENTLNFTSKARLIKNKPEKNEKLSKKNLMEMLAEETMKLKRDLEAARSQKGLYISKESYIEMTDRLKELTEQRKVAIEQYKTLLEECNKNMALFNNLSADFDEKCYEFEDLTANIEHEREKFKEKLDDHSKEITVREHLLEKYREAESKLTERAKRSKSVLENLYEQNLALHNKIDRQSFPTRCKPQHTDFNNDFKSTNSKIITKRLQSLTLKKMGSKIITKRLQSLTLKKMGSKIITKRLQSLTLKKMGSKIITKRLQSLTLKKMGSKIITKRLQSLTLKKIGSEIITKRLQSLTLKKMGSKIITKRLQFLTLKKMGSKIITKRLESLTYKKMGSIIPMGNKINKSSKPKPEISLSLTLFCG
ncbi:Kinesin- protein 11 [Homalodisca vitripennis]|nr:Kinesin- protein 11 [Homalodisca vitripennis]